MTFQEQKQIVEKEYLETNNKDLLKKLGKLGLLARLEEDKKTASAETVVKLDQLIAYHQTLLEQLP